MHRAPAPLSKLNCNTFGWLKRLCQAALQPSQLAVLGRHVWVRGQLSAVGPKTGEKRAWAELAAIDLFVLLDRRNSRAAGSLGHGKRPKTLAKRPAKQNQFSHMASALDGAIIDI